MTEDLYDTFVGQETREARTFEQASDADKAQACRHLCIAWAKAIREGSEEAFISNNDLPTAMMDFKRRRIEADTPELIGDPAPKVAALADVFRTGAPTLKLPH